VLGGESYLFWNNFDWWVFTADGHSRVKTGAFQAFRQQPFPLEFVENTFPPRIFQWKGNDLIFSVGTGDSVNTWSIRLSPDSRHVEGAPRQLTSGEGVESQPQRIAGDRLVFAGLSKSANLWSLPVDTNHGIARSDKPEPVTNRISLEHFGSISADGRYLVFTSTRSGAAHLWLKDLSTGLETRVSTTEEWEERPEISPDGSMIAYASGKGMSIVPRIHSTGSEILCADCGYPWDWSHDNRTLLYLERKPVWAVGSFDTKTGKKSTVLAAARWPLYQSRFSPDEKWLAFGQDVNYSTSRLFIAPMRDGKAAPESEWIPIAYGDDWCDKPRWSPDGNLIYFVSQRDGYRCMWAQRLARDTKRPLGEPFSIAHFHSARLSMTNVNTGSLEIEVAKDKVIFNLEELTGNIWMASRK
jgi:Tol biopolymer transport system component